jgi:hypothetical protein
LLHTDKQEYWKQNDEFERKYYFDTSRVNGAIPICTEGCALRTWLVLTGDQAGRLWYDGRADCKGLAPLLLSNGTPATFSPWYTDWLENALRRVQMH